MEASKIKQSASTSKSLKTVSSSTTTTMSKEVVEQKRPPKDAEILSQSITTSTEQIENGYLVSKNYNIKYSVKGNTDWCYYTKKWYSKDDPLTITIEDKALADAFDEDK